MKKVHLILVDGMRPDALEKCSNPYIKELLNKSLYTLNARTVFPSVTLPCHMSLFHSVEPVRHGIATNFYMPQVRPVNGICEQIRPKTSAMFYNWEQLRDLARPGTLIRSAYFSMKTFGLEESNRRVCEEAVDCVENQNPDFCFTYLGWTDEQGHATGWMKEEYYHSIDESFRSIEKILNSLPEEGTAIIVADHGGHDRTHGMDIPEDMTIPVIIYGKDIVPGKINKEVSILDIAPTVVKLLGCENAPEWEGKSIL